MHVTLDFRQCRCCFGITAIQSILHPLRQRRELWIFLGRVERVDGHHEIAESLEVAASWTARSPWAALAVPSGTTSGSATLGRGHGVTGTVERSGAAATRATLVTTAAASLTAAVTAAASTSETTVGTVGVNLGDVLLLADREVVPDVSDENTGLGVGHGRLSRPRIQRVNNGLGLLRVERVLAGGINLRNIPDQAGQLAFFTVAKTAAPAAGASGTAESGAVRAWLRQRQAHGQKGQGKSEEQGSCVHVASD